MSVSQLNQKNKHYTPCRGQGGLLKRLTVAMSLMATIVHTPHSNVRSKLCHQILY